MKAKTLVTLLASALVCQFSFSNIDTSKHPGSINGELSTSASGAANYNIKLDLPKSSVCPSPEIGISYNSQSGNGILGVGFTLTGLSSINRVPRTIYHDGKLGGVSNSTSDVYAIDGNRLIKKSGTYGKDGAVYGTEVENFAKITQEGTRGENGANWFSVVVKDGTKYEYGCQSGKIAYDYTLTNRKRKRSVIQWPISKITYSNGEKVVYKYVQDGLAFYVDSIEYDHNTIGFIYEDRPDQIPIYYDGVKDAIKKCLKEIVINCNGKLYRKYEIKYKDNGGVFSKIESITESTGKGEQLNPTVFEWGSYSSRHIVDNDINVEMNNAWTRAFICADVNGDGLSDLIGIDGNRNLNVSVNRKREDGTISIKGYTSSNPGEFENYKIADTNGNGKQSLIALQFGKGHFARFLEYINGANGSDVYNLPLSSYNSAPVFTASDINNDGKDELIYIETSHVNGKHRCGIVSEMKRTDNFNLSTYDIPQKVMARDFDADGLKDLVVISENSITIYKNNGGDVSSMFSYSYYTSKTKQEEVYTGDFNGDGLEDILMHNVSNGQWWKLKNMGGMTFLYGSGTSVLNNLSVKDETFTEKNDDKEFCMVLDFDNDGKSDLLISDPKYDKKTNWLGQVWGEFNCHNFHWFRSTGEGFVLQHSCQVKDGQLAKYFSLGDFDGDGSVDVLNWGYNCKTGESSSKKWHIYKNETHNTQSDKIVSITNGSGRTDKIEYTPLSDGSVYLSNASSSPKLAETHYLSVVKSITSDAGNKYQRKETFKYSGSRMHREGKGFMCFEEMRKTDENNGLTEVKRSEINRDFYVPYVKEQSINDGWETISKATNTTKFSQKSGKIVLAETTEATEDNVTSGVKTTKTGFVDSNGNTTSEETTLNNDDVTEKTSYTYTYANGNGSTPNRVKSKKTVKTHKGATAHTIDVKYEYDTQGRITKTTSITGNSNSKENVVTEYGDYNTRGQFCKKTVKQGDSPAETETYVYDSRGRMTEKTFSDGLKESYAYNNEGQVLSHTDVYGNTTTYEYDNWGDVTLKKTPDGTEERTKTEWCSDNGATYKTTISRSGSGDEVHYYDLAGKEIRKEYSNISGLVCVDTEYDNNGRVSRSSKPYFKGNTPLWKAYTYDKLGRITSISEKGQTTSYEYNGLTTSITAPSGMTKVKRTNAAGDVISITDNSGSSLTFKYNSAGNVVSTTTGGTTTTITYDDEDRQTSLKDADGGVTKYEYRSDGLMTKQTDANGNVTETEYDGQRRVKSKTFFNKKKKDYDDKITYAYDNYGRLTGAKGLNNSEAYTYDGLGSMKSKSTEIDGQTYTFNYEYDGYGNLSKKTFPQGYSLMYSYNNGELTDIVDNKGNNIWHLDAKNAYDQTTGYTWGNGVKSTNGYDSYGMLLSQKTGSKQNLSYRYDDRNGNLTSREDVVRHQRETFEYDDLNRLTDITLYKNGRFNGSKTIEYSNNGNITSKSDVGEYSYNTSHPHAVSMVEGENDIPSATQAIEYNASGKATRLTDDDGRVELSITYGIDGERVKCVWKDSTGNVTKTRLYFDEYEVTETNGRKEDVCYINSPDGLIAVMMHHGNTYKKYYICTDHLGSITLLMNDGGNTVERHAYDAWGRERNVNDWSSYDVESGKLDRGYTGHEMLREFGLINMNGRMYDQILGRMLSPDNYVQDPFDPQCYNRYSYCKNNPLVYVDPSGEIAWFVPVFIGAVIGTYSGGVIANNGNYNPIKWDYSSGKTWGYMLGGAVAGGISGYFGGAIAASGMPFANTFGILSASFTNSVLTSLYTGGQTPVSVSLGAVSYDMTNNEWGYLGKDRNSVLENIGYSLGTLANLHDIYNIFDATIANLYTQTRDNGEFDPISHSAIVAEDKTILMSYGPNDDNVPNSKIGFAFKRRLSTSTYNTHIGDGVISDKLRLNSRLFSVVRSISERFKYQGATSNCVNWASIGLWLNGIPNVGIHPFFLHESIAVYNTGVYNIVASQILK